ncbi:MAG: hypothetical protein KDA90_21825 [Planctomycetaceae bacterium]|nr:hypothetical protein [Planctomycetaceae bacterium]
MKQINTVALLLFLGLGTFTSLAEAQNTLGDKVVELYEALPPAQQKPGGDCYAVMYKRINSAVKETCGVAQELPNLRSFKAFDRIWASKNDPQSSWIVVDVNYRGKGAAGAMASIGMGTLVEGDDIWNGKLQPGAVIQTWKLRSDFERVRDGKVPQDIGHSFIFLRYAKDSSDKITGMLIADQGTDWCEPNQIKESQFEYWVAANIRCM